LPSEIRLPPVQGLLLRLKVRLGEGGVASLALELLLPLLQPLHSLDLVGPLGFQSLVQGAQLGLVLYRDGLPLGHDLLPPGHLLFPLGRLQLPGTHLLEVSLVLLVVPLKLGPLGGELSGRRLGPFLQLGAPVTEALVLSLKRLPLPQDCCLSVTEDLVGTEHQAGEWDWRRFLLGARPKPPPKHHLHILRRRRGLELDAPPVSPPVSVVGADLPAGTSSATATPPNVGAAAMGSPAGACEAAGAVLAAAGGGPPAPPSADSCS
jgi:hypothetical protein